MRNTLGLLAVAALLLGVTGCATSTATTGRDFDSTKAALIQNGQTTADELVAMLGQPYTKQVQSNDEEHWTYQYVAVTAKAQAGPFGSSNVESNGHKKMLTVVLKNKVVIDHIYNEGPVGQSVKTESFK